MAFAAIERCQATTPPISIVSRSCMSGAYSTSQREMGPVPVAYLGTLSHAEAWPVMICQAVYAPQEVQAGEYLVSTSPAHCDFMQFDHTTPLSDVYMCARVVQRRKTAKTGPS